MRRERKRMIAKEKTTEKEREKTRQLRSDNDRGRTEKKRKSLEEKI